MSNAVHRPATDLSELVFGRLERLTVGSTEATQITQAETVDVLEKEIVDPTRLTQAVDRGSLRHRTSQCRRLPCCHVLQRLATITFLVGSSGFPLRPLWITSATSAKNSTLEVVCSRIVDRPLHEIKCLRQSGVRQNSKQSRQSGRVLTEEQLHAIRVTELATAGGCACDWLELDSENTRLAVTAAARTRVIVTRLPRRFFAGTRTTTDSSRITSMPSSHNSCTIVCLRRRAKRFLYIESLFPKLPGSNC